MVQPGCHREGESESDGAEPRGSPGSPELREPEIRAAQGEKEFDRPEEDKRPSEWQGQHQSSKRREGRRLAVGGQRHSASVPPIPERYGALLVSHSNGLRPRHELRRDITQGRAIWRGTGSRVPRSELRAQMINGNRRAVGRETRKKKNDWQCKKDEK